MSAESRSHTVVGAGPVGLATAVGLAYLGHRVELVEVDDERRAALAMGSVPFFDPGLAEEFANQFSSGNLSTRELVTPDAAVVLVCVGTPIDRGGNIDLTQLKSALKQLRPIAEAGVPIVIRSTLPLGGTVALANEIGLPRASLLTNPEFLSEGSALNDFLHPPRIVVGTFAETMPEHVALLTKLFESLDAPVRIMNVAAAELVKNAANSYLSTRLAFVNEISTLAEEYGSDVGQVIEALSDDPRIGTSFFRPALAFGGSCLPNASAALAHAGAQRGLSLALMSAAAESNRAQLERFMARVRSLVGGVRGRRIAVLGLAFKQGTDDIRDSPALSLALTLASEGAIVSAFDPAVRASASPVLESIHICDDSFAALRGADAAVIATDWPELTRVDWRAAREVMARPLVIDGRRLLDPQVMRELGFAYRAVGSPDDVSAR